MRAARRHPQLLAYAATLEQLGYRVFGMPDLRIDPVENVFGSTNLDFGYCNVLPGLRRGRPAVRCSWGIPAGSGRGCTIAIRRRRAGPHCNPAVANALMLLHGGLLFLRRPGVGNLLRRLAEERYLN